MPLNVNCQHFTDGSCTHHAAPRQWIGQPRCVLLNPPTDPRLRGCALVYPLTKPDGHPLPPPMRGSRLGDVRVYTLTPMGHDVTTTKEMK